MPDGLDILDAKRERRATTRRAGVPPSQNQPATAAVPVRSGELSSADVEPAQSAPSSTPAPSSTSETVDVEQLVKTTIHLNAADDRFLDEVSFVGRRAQPKVDASRSAVTRLALRRLAAHMTPDEIVDDLRRGISNSSGAGRKRLASPTK